MKNALCLLLLSLSLQRIKCQGMESIESSVQKKPGETLTLSCRGSGFTFDCCSMHWIRQQAGKPLVWIGRVYSHGNSHDYAESFKGRAEITRDNSKSMTYLKLSGLTAEDSAVYYCAKQGWGDAFDYWGKGTQVTVANETTKPPVVFKMSQCNSPTDSLILGCLASEFSPENSVNFRWSSNGNAITNVIQHSTANKQKFSYITITKEQRDQSKITCTADHPTKPVSETFREIQAPTLSLVLVPTEKNTFAMCVIEDFYPETITVQWKENNIYKQSQTDLEYKLNMDGFYTALSLYKLNEIVIPNTEYACEVSHREKTFHKTQNFKATFRLMLKPPIEREMFSNNTTVLEAVVSGDLPNAVKEASVSCKMDNVPINSVSQENVSKVSKSQYERIHKVTVDTTKWFNGGKVTCTTRDTLNNKDIEQEIHINKGDGQTPSVKIYKPDDINSEHISHVCEVSSPSLGDVYIMWKVNNVYTEGKSSGLIQQQGSTSVLSILTISKKEFENPKTTINCAVVHANMKDTASPLLTSASKSKQPESKACAYDYGP